VKAEEENFSVPRYNVHILEVPEVSLSGWQSGKGGENVFQNQLSMLLISRENLRGSTPTQWSRMNHNIGAKGGTYGSDQPQGTQLQGTDIFHKEGTDTQWR